MIELCSNLNWDAITALTSIGLLAVTAWAAYSVSSLTKYSHRQNDREIVERIYSIYSNAMQDFMVMNEYTNKLFFDVQRAIDLAALYGFNDIEKFLSDKKAKFKEARLAHIKCYDHQGNALSTHNHDDVQREADIIEELVLDYSENKDIKVFGKRLKQHNDL